MKSEEEIVMSNMSYCRFQNTLMDFRDCYEHIFDANSEDEICARASLIREAANLLIELGVGNIHRSRDIVQAIEMLNEQKQYE